MAAMRLDMQGVVAQEQQQIGGAIFCASAVCGDENPKGNVAIISADTNQATTRSGPYELALEWKTNPKDPEDGWPVAELRLDGEAVKTIWIDKKMFGRHYASARLVELDPSNEAPEIVVTRHSGGMHCCSEIAVWSKTSKAVWRRFPFGSFDSFGNGGAAAYALADSREDIAGRTQSD